MLPFSAGDGATRAPHHPQFNRGVYIYDVTDLSKPRGAFEVGYECTVLTPDATGATIYSDAGSSRDHSNLRLTGHAMDGTQSFALDVWSGRRGIRHDDFVRLHPYPPGNAMLIETMSRFALVGHGGSSRRPESAP